MTAFPTPVDETLCDGGAGSTPTSCPATAHRVEENGPESVRLLDIGTEKRIPNRQMRSKPRISRLIGWPPWASPPEQRSPGVVRVCPHSPATATLLMRFANDWDWPTCCIAVSERGGTKGKSLRHSIFRITLANRANFNSPKRERLMCLEDEDHVALRHQRAV